MINLFPKATRYKFGAVTLVFAVVLIVLCTLIIIFAANYGRMQDMTVANQTRNTQAFEAAEAGQEFGINYLKQNAATIKATASGGNINYNIPAITDVTLANGSKFTIVYTNPINGNYDLIEITSTGVNADNSSTRIIKQQVQMGSLLVTAPNSALTTKAAVNMSGNTTIINTANSNTVLAGGGVAESGNASLITQTGTYTTTAAGSGVQQNLSSLSSLTNEQFFSSYFGTSISSMSGQFAQVFNNTGSTNYSDSLAGLTGTSVWINQTGGGTASISGNTTIGSASAPVLLVVNGPFSISGNVTIYGFIFVIGPSGIVTLTGNINIIGGLATTDDLTFSGNSNLTFNPTVLEAIKTNPSMSYFAKVPGSWKDH